MKNFWFAMNATMPVFLIILLGFFLQKIRLTNDSFNKAANEYVFKIALPISLFRSIANMDFYADFDLGFCLFCFASTTVMFLAVWAASWLFIKDKTQIGAFAQASARSSAALLGVSFATNIYGDAGLVPLMILSAVPFFNVYAVLILSFSPQIGENGEALQNVSGHSALNQACRNVLKNPMIIGILAGVPFSLLQIQVPEMLDSALASVGATASPIALIVVGASFSGREALTRIRPAIAATMVKLVILPAVFLPAAALLGFRDSAMVAILIMAGAPTTVACYVMARNMHADGTLTSNTVMLSTLLSSVTITFWLFVLKTLALI